jgi:hypothetical protein
MAAILETRNSRHNGVMDRDPIPLPKPLSALEPEDYYYEGEFLVFTAAYHRKRGYCCGSGCRHCPYGNGPAPDPQSAKPQS